MAGETKVELEKVSGDWLRWELIEDGVGRWGSIPPAVQAAIRAALLSDAPTVVVEEDGDKAFVHMPDMMFPGTYRLVKVEDADG